MVSYDNISEKKLKQIKKHGYEQIDTKTQYELVRYKGPTNIVLYNTGKLLIQGSEQNVNDAKKLIKFLGITTPDKKLAGLAVGSDETLKGDTFGGIVVAGFKADDKIRDEIVKMGVKDSKQLLRPDIVKLAQELIEKFPNNYHVESLRPKEYNQLNMILNVTKILDKLHARCCAKLSRSAIHIVDKYPGCVVGDIIEAKADSKYPEVAAASIIARYAGLKQIKELEMEAGFFIPLGSTHVDSALLELEKKTLDPKNYVKLKFKNVVRHFSL
jgi:ribonuclease HII